MSEDGTARKGRKAPDGFKNWDEYNKAYRELRELNKDYIKGHPFQAGLLTPAKTSGIVCPFCGNGSGKDGTGADVYVDRKRVSHKIGGTECGRSVTFTCFKAGCSTRADGRNSFDILDVIGSEYGLSEFDDIYRKACELYGLEYEPIATAEPVTPAPAEEPATEEPHSEEEEPDYLALINEAREHLDGTDYWKRRGLSREVCGRYYVGYLPEWKHPNAPATVPTSPRLIVPTSRHSYLARDTREGLTAEQDAYKKQKVGKIHIFNAKTLQKMSRPVFVTEGEINALSIIECGFDAVATGTVSMTGKFVKTLEGQTLEHPLIIAMDADEAGHKASVQMSERLKAEGKFFLLADTSTLFIGCKDANDALVKDREAFKKELEKMEKEAEEKMSSSKEEPEEVEEKEPGSLPGVSVLDRFMDAVQTRRYEPVRTGIPAIDNALMGGFTRATLVTLGGAPGIGKTIFAQWVFERMAEAGNDVLYFNLEMPNDNMIARSLSRRLYEQKGVDVNTVDLLRGYSWDGTTRKYVQEMAEDYRRNVAPRMMYKPEGVTNSLDSINRAMQKEADRAKKEGRRVPIVCIDYLQYIRFDDRDPIEGMKKAIYAFNDYAKSNGTIVFLIIANNRESNKDGITTMESGRDTSAIEYSGDTMLGLSYTAIEDERFFAYENENGEEQKEKVTLKMIRALQRKFGETGETLPGFCNEISLNILKNRNGITGRRVRLAVDGAHSIFRVIAGTPSGPKYRMRIPYQTEGEAPQKEENEKADGFVTAGTRTGTQRDKRRKAIEKAIADVVADKQGRPDEWDAMTVFEVQERLGKGKQGTLKRDIVDLGMNYEVVTGENGIDYIIPKGNGKTGEL